MSFRVLGFVLCHLCSITLDRTMGRNVKRFWLTLVFELPIGFTYSDSWDWVCSFWNEMWVCELKTGTTSLRKSSPVLPFGFVSLLFFTLPTVGYSHLNHQKVGIYWSPHPMKHSVWEQLKVLGVNEGQIFKQILILLSPMLISHQCNFSWVTPALLLDWGQQQCL